MQQVAGESGDARSVIERSLEHAQSAVIDRLPTAVVQRYVELEMSRAGGPVSHRHRIPTRPAVRVHARIGWSRFLLMSTTGSGVGAAALVDTQGRVIEVSTLAALASAGPATTVSPQEAMAVLRVLVGVMPGLIDDVAAALSTS